MDRMRLDLALGNLDGDAPVTIRSGDLRELLRAWDDCDEFECQLAESVPQNEHDEAVAGAYGDGRASWKHEDTANALFELREWVAAALNDREAEALRKAQAVFDGDEAYEG